MPSTARNAMPLPEDFAAKAGEAAAMLRALAHEARLMVLCQLSQGELTAGELLSRSTLSQSALSQHLAKLRAERLVATRRDAQNIFYRLADPKAEKIIAALAAVYCPPTMRKKRK